MVNRKTRSGMITKILVACTHKRTTSFFFFALYDSPGNKFPRRFCAVFVSDWLGSLVHIHSNRRVSLISNRLLMREDVSSGWGPVLFLKEEDTWSWKDLTLKKKSLFNINQRWAMLMEAIPEFCSEDHTSTKQFPKRVNTWDRCLFWSSLSVSSTEQDRTEKRYIKFCNFKGGGQFEWHWNKS